MMLGKAVGVLLNRTSQSSLMFEGLYYSANCPERGGVHLERGMKGGKKKEKEWVSIYMQTCFVLINTGRIKLEVNKTKNG